MAVVIVPILDYIWGKKLVRRQIIGACLAAFGVWALELGLGGQQNAITEGDMLSLIQLLMFGLGFWRLEATTVKYPMEAGRLAVLQLLMVFFISLSYLVADSLLSSDAHNVLPTASRHGCKILVYWKCYFRPVSSPPLSRIGWKQIMQFTIAHLNSTIDLD